MSSEPRWKIIYFLHSSGFKNFNVCIIFSIIEICHALKTWGATVRHIGENLSY